MRSSEEGRGFQFELSHLTKMDWEFWTKQLDEEVLFEDGEFWEFVRVFFLLLDVNLHSINKR